MVELQNIMFYYLILPIKIDLRSEKTVALSNLSIYWTWKNIKSSCNNNKIKISAPTWSEEFEYILIGGLSTLSRCFLRSSTIFSVYKDLSFLYYAFIELIILLYNILVIFFDRYK